MNRLSLLALFFTLPLVLVLGFAPAPGGAATSAYAYHWPIKPFDIQHPIRGGFGDPRTMAIDQPFGETGPTDGGAYSFHTGIDIVGRPGTAVYPVVSGRVVLAHRHEIVVQSGNARSFQDWHLWRNVRLGQEVVAEQTILGWIHRPFNHVHLTEIDHNRNQNPLAAGHLEPYDDRTKPHAIALDIADAGATRLTEGGTLGPNDQLAIDAVDPPAMAVSGPFGGLPQAPALVEWRLRTGRIWSHWHAAADFEHTVPNRDRFWNVYAPGTYQNVPVFERRLCRGVAGVYLFRVDLDPRTLQPGTYELEARVSDIRGNFSTTTWDLQVAGA
jgi:hypothetical protein